MSILKPPSCCTDRRAGGSNASNRQQEGLDAWQGQGLHEVLRPVPAVQRPHAGALTLITIPQNCCTQKAIELMSHLDPSQTCQLTKHLNHPIGKTQTMSLMLISNCFRQLNANAVGIDLGQPNLMYAGFSMALDRTFWFTAFVCT